MTESEKAPETPSTPIPGPLAGNVGDPIALTGVQLDGVAAEAARGGQVIKVWTRLAITSDDPIFHRLADGLAGVIRHHTLTVGTAVDLERAKVVLLVIRPDQTAELWVDTAAICMNIMAKRDIKAGTPLFESDIVDVVDMAFPLVQIGKEDKVACVFRQDSRFGLHFDFNPDKNLSIDEFDRTLGSLFRT